MGADNNLKFGKSIDFARQMDRNDPIFKYRDQFLIPKNTDGSDKVYLCGNSLGLQPKQTQSYVVQELNDWGKMAVEGHTQAKNPWLPYHEFLADKTSRVVGAKPNEVVVMNTLSVNLHLMMVSFYRPTEKRYKILIEKDAFPSDRYAVESQLKFHGYDPKEALIELNGDKEDSYISLGGVEEIISQQGESIALILIGNVNYYTGQFFDMKKIAQMGHAMGCAVGFDCAHGAGNVELNLHDSGIDFAVWCNYKYLNSGPGSIAGCFVHERHALSPELPRFSGWWGHNKSTRFNMRSDFDVLAGAEGWQLSNPPILSLAAIKSSLDLFDEVGISVLREKSIELTGYLEYLLRSISGDVIKIITPSNPDERGCQLSVRILNSNTSLHRKLTAKGIISDWREPDVIRLAPVPLYNSFEDVWTTYSELDAIIQSE